MYNFSIGSRFFIWVTLLASVLLTSGCIEKKPSKQEISSYLRIAAPDFFEVSDFEYEVFSGSNSGSGRISIVGTLVLTQDLYTPDPTEPWLIEEALKHNVVVDRELRSSSIPLGNGASRMIPDVSEYVVSIAKGAHFKFRAELRYQGNVDGFRFEGGIRRPVSHELKTTNEALKSGYIAGDTLAEQRLNAVLEHHQKRVDIEADFSAFRSEIFAFIRDSHLTMTIPQNSGSLQPRIKAYSITCPNRALSKQTKNGIEKEDDWVITCEAISGGDKRRLAFLLSINSYNYTLQNRLLGACINYLIYDSENDKWTEPSGRPWDVVPFFSTVNCNFRWKDGRFKSTGNGGAGGWIEKL